MIDDLCARSNQPRIVAGGGVPYLMMLGVLSGGWLLMKQALYAEAQKSEEGAHFAFLDQKIASLSVFRALSLPQAEAFAMTAQKAGDAIEALSVDMLQA